jgi:hypothetical protein
MNKECIPEAIDQKQKTPVGVFCFVGGAEGAISGVASELL